MTQWYFKGLAVWSAVILAVVASLFIGVWLTGPHPENLELAGIMILTTFLCAPLLLGIGSGYMNTPIRHAAWIFPGYAVALSFMALSQRIIFGIPNRSIPPDFPPYGVAALIFIVAGYILARLFRFVVWKLSQRKIR